MNVNAQSIHRSFKKTTSKGLLNQAHGQGFNFMKGFQHGKTYSHLLYKL